MVAAISLLPEILRPSSGKVIEEKSILTEFGITTRYYTPVEIKIEDLAHWDRFLSSPQFHPP